MLDSEFGQIAAILVIAAVVGGVAQLLRQPLVVAYVGVGVLVGPAGLGLVVANENVALLAEVGIALLLFLVGLKLDWHQVRSTGPVALAVGVSQVVLTAALGTALALLLGQDPTTAVYLGLALAFSSTIVIVKLLSDRHELDSLHGRIAVGLLVVQDLMVVVALIVITTVGSSPAGLGPRMVGVGLRGAALVVVVWLLAHHVLPTLLDRLARVPELVVLFGLAWAVAIGAVTQAVGLSMEVGAFLAGLSLASTSYREAIGARLVSLRDVLVLFFFIDLGSGLELGTMGAQVLAALVLSAFVLVVKPVLVGALMTSMGYRRRAAARTGILTGQVSEFSLLLVALGLELGHVDAELVGLVTLVTLVTIGISTYQIGSSQWWADRLAPVVGLLERPLHRHQTGEPSADYDAVVIGGGRFGSAVVERLDGRRVLVVDHNPVALRWWRERGVDTVYGDVIEPELVTALPLADSTTVVCTVPDLAVNLTLTDTLRRAGYRGTLAVTALSVREAGVLAADDVVVLRPFQDAADSSLRRLFET
ncbi:cation:proton antiporter [Isoptericola sp. b441]|uniref:Cation:proton antiporter n=1 Tax=Actinotalea lenta TaxID=3064654 RepID=A0ABT9D8H7_9CELL|nr:MULTISPECIES: cation:proton antiporter [unclassified Isoptericola]MDO8107195.1 cation:proton antiporter [Isoptericola sp. b441]MDO8121127.1 cation:proton antiporter [Isoptericola sp. b490]